MLTPLYIFPFQKEIMLWFFCSLMYFEHDETSLVQKLSSTNSKFVLYELAFCFGKEEREGVLGGDQGVVP